MGAASVSEPVTTNKMENKTCEEERLDTVRQTCEEEN